MKTSAHIKLIFVSVLLIAVLVISDAQFFTKTGSKSIPRMGRRADNSLWSLIPHNPSYKLKISDSFLNKYNDKQISNPEKPVPNYSGDGVDFMEPIEDDLIESSEKPKTAPLQVDEDSDDRFNTNSEVRKLQKILSKYIDKTQNGL